MRHTALAAALASLLLANPALAAPDGAMLGRTCAGCHGPDGNSLGPATPSLAGGDPAYFVESMRAFREGKRPATVMDRIARGYDAAAFEAMAAYFAARPPRPTPQSTDAALVTAGAPLHRRFCDKCHGDGGRETDESGRLAGQPQAYLRWSLEEIATGARPAPRNMRKQLDTVYIRHGDDGLAALAAFYASQAER